MPPAFNLSQDQTLQFDLSKLKLILTLNLIPKPFSPETSFSSSVSTSFVLEPNAYASGPQRAPTPIGCRLLKSRLNGPRGHAKLPREMLQQRGAILGCFRNPVNTPSQPVYPRWAYPFAFQGFDRR